MDRSCKLLLLLFMLLYASAFPEQQEESLFARRILEFWRDGDTAIVTQQIASFRQQFPSSKYEETWEALLGQTAYEAGDYLQALNHFNSLTTPELLSRYLLPRCHCLNLLQRYEELHAMACSADTEDPNLSYYYAQGYIHLQEYEKAQPLLQKALSGRCRPAALQSLGEVAALQQRWEESANYYDLAAASDRSLLLCKATAIAHHDPLKAVAICLSLSDTPLASQGAHHALGLLLERGLFREILARQATWDLLLRTPEREELNYFLGISCCQTQDYAISLAYLRSYVEQSTLNERVFSALYYGMVAASHESDLQAVEYFGSLLTRHFTNHPDYPKRSLQYVLFTTGCRLQPSKRSLPKNVCSIPCS